MKETTKRLGQETLLINGIEASYNRGFHLGPLSIALPPGVTCLLGHNGSGKTTLLACVAGMPSVHAGTPSFSAGDATLARKDLRIGYMPQESTLPRSARCEDFLYYAAWLQGIPAESRATAVTRALSQVNLTENSTQRIRTLSGGMRRRLLLASAALGPPDILLLDEPTVGLDPHQRISILQYIRDIGVHSHVLLSTHIMEDVERIAERIIVLSQGSVIKTIDCPLPDSSSPLTTSDHTRRELLDSVLQFWLEEDESA